jgi:glycosyltransferase involved in cell wall biosynthesis
MPERIAFYAPLKPPDHPIASGDRQMARMLLRALQNAGYDAFLASREIAYSKRPGLEHLDARKAAAHGEASRLLAQFEATGRKPALWFSYHPYDKSPDWLGEEICATLDIPMVTAEPCKTGQGPHGEWLPWREESKRIISSAAMNLVMTHSDREFLAGFVPDAKVQWLDPFIDTQLLVAEPVEGNPWLGGGTKLLSVGMMRPGAKLESYTVLAHALGLLRNCDWSLAIAGGGPCEGEIRAMFEPLGERVSFVGERTGGEVLTLMEMCDVLAWPGCREAYGMVFLEAASRGKPAVALDTMGVPRVVVHQQTGLLANPPDAQTYAGCLRAMITDGELRERLGRGAKAFVEGERSGARAAQRLRQVIDGVLAGWRA